jgi:Putative Na+/H+ antiporter
VDADAGFFGAVALTAITDNAALTYLGSLVPGLSDEFKVALVARAVAGGGPAVIANAPNPAGEAILHCSFGDQTVSPLGLLPGARPPTLVALLAFRLLQTAGGGGTRCVRPHGVSRGARPRWRRCRSSSSASSLRRRAGPRRDRGRPAHRSARAA